MYLGDKKNNLKYPRLFFNILFYLINNYYTWNQIVSTTTETIPTSNQTELFFSCG